MSNNDKVLEITSKFILELSAQKPSNLMMAVKSHYDLWQSELIVLLKERNLPVYECLARLLYECGYENATASLVRSYMGRVSQSKNKGKKGPSEVVAAPDAIGRITTTVDMNQGAVVPPSAVVPGQNPVGGSQPVAVVSAGAKFSFKDALDRLRNEGSEAPWSAADDELHQAYLAMCKERGARNIADLQHHIKETEFTKNGAYTEYLTKVRRTGKVF